MNCELVAQVEQEVVAEGLSQFDIDAPVVEVDGYKILVHQDSDGTLDPLSILLPLTPDKIPNGRDAERAYFQQHLVSINAIENLPGITFLPDLETSQPVTARAVKAHKAETFWSDPDAWPRRLDGNC